MKSSKISIYVLYNLIFLLLLFDIALLVLILVFSHSNNLKNCDTINYSSALYTQWLADTNPAKTLNLTYKKLNRSYKLKIKNTDFKDINIILPLARACQEGDTLTLIFTDIDENLGRTYYLFEDILNSIFFEYTYFINALYKKIKLTVVNGAWAEDGCGIIQ